MMLAAGGAAFAAAPFLGRTRGLGVGLIVLFASYLIYGYSTLSPIIEALKPLSFFVWTAGHRPIAGVTDWPSVAVLGAVDLLLFAIGVFAFTRRDLGASANVGWLRLPSLPAGIAGPFSRQLADRFGHRDRVGRRGRRVRDPDRRFGRCVRRDDLVAPARSPR